MKNAVTIIVAVLLIIIVIVTVIANFSINNENEAENYYKLIEEKILEENMDDSKKELTDYKTFYVLDKYGMKKEENKVFIYAYVFVENYYKNDDGRVVLDSGYAIPHRFEFENGQYVGKEITLDGSYYEDSLKELYPLSMRMKMDLFKDDEKLLNNIKEQVEKYYSISYDEVIYN